MKNDLILRVRYENEVYDLDVLEGVPLRVDMSTVEVGKLGRIFGIGSQEFTLPGTKRNNKFFKHAYDIGADNPPAMYNSIDAWLLQKGETLLQGQLELLEVVTDEHGFVNYNVQVSDKVVQFKESLKGKFLRDADWSAYDHIFTSASVIDSWSDNLLDGSVFYPLGAYGRDDDNQGFSIYPPLGYVNDDLGSSSVPLNLRQFLPAVKLKDALDVIFDQVGFRYTGSFTETDDFNNLYLFAKANDGFGPNVPSASAEFAAIETANKTLDTLETAYVTASIETLDPKNAYNPSTSEYTAITTGEHIFNCSVEFDNPAKTLPGTKSAQVTIELYKGTSKPGTQFATQTRFFDSTDGDVLTLSATGKTTMTGGSDKFFATVFFEAIPAPGQTPVLTLLTQNLSCTQAPPVFEDEPIEIELQFNPELKSEDVITGLIQQFNLVFIPDIADQRTIRIEQFDDWIRDGEFKDWTRKFDTSKRTSIKHPISELPKTVILTNDEDTDRFSKVAEEQEPYRQYGSLELISVSNNAQDEDEIKTVFAPIVIGSSFQTGSNYPNIDLSSTTAFPHLYKYDNDKVKSYAFKPRIGYKVTNTLPSGSNIYIGLSGNNTAVSESYATIANVSQLPSVSGSTSDLHFNNTYGDFAASGLGVNNGVTAFEEYWQTYYESLYWDDGRFVTLDVVFEPSEFQQIKLNDRILIKNQYYRINKIKGFNLTQDDVVTVELLKLYPAYFELQPGDIVTTTTTQGPTTTTTSTTTTEGPTTTTTTEAPGTFNLEYLIIGGGGCGGSCNIAFGNNGAGGGGAGGYRSSVIGENSGGPQPQPAEPLYQTVLNRPYTIQVGAGLAAGSEPFFNNLSRLIDTVTAVEINAFGGGEGGDVNNNFADDGGGGGSGGGGGNMVFNRGDGGSAIGTPPSQGNVGGDGDTTNEPFIAGGGGGASQVGDIFDGGNGLTSSITGTAVTRAGGGGGGNAFSDNGGSGGGGRGSSFGGFNSEPGEPNTGGGGGGASTAGTELGSNGGSGVVILRYPSEYSVNVGPGLTASTTIVGANAVTVFTEGIDDITFLDSPTSTTTSTTSTTTSTTTTSTTTTSTTTTPPPNTEIFSDRGNGGGYTSGLVCTVTDPTDNSFYLAGTGKTVTVDITGEVVYADPFLTTPITGEQLYFGVNDNSGTAANQVIQIDFDGTVMSWQSCGGTTTTTSTTTSTTSTTTTSTTTTVPSFTVLGGDTGTNNNETIACADESNTQYTVIDNDSSGTITTGDEIVGLSNGFLKIETNQFVELDTGIVQAPGLQSCATTTTTTTTTTTLPPSTQVFSNQLEGDGGITSCQDQSTLQYLIYLSGTGKSVETSGCIGEIVYDDNGLTDIFVGQSLWYGVADDIDPSVRYYVQINNSGEIIDWVDCNATTTTSTTTIPSFTINGSVRITSAGLRCSGTPDEVLYRVIDNDSTGTVTVGDDLKVNSSGNNAPNGYYVLAGNISVEVDTGEIIDVLDCNTTTTTTTSTTTTTTIPGIQHEVDAAQDAGASTSGQACNAITSGNIYSNRANVASIIVGDILYSNDLLTNAWNGGNGSQGKWYGLSDSAGQAEYAMRIDIAGEVKEIVDCSVTTTSTTTIATTAYNDIGYDASNANTACNNYPSGNVFYGDNATWQNVGTIYTNSSGTNFAPPGFYSDGTYVHEVTNQGSVTDTAICGGP